jgi:hypothetical protein
MYEKHEIDLSSALMISSIWHYYKKQGESYEQQEFKF